MLLEREVMVDSVFELGQRIVEDLFGIDFRTNDGAEPFEMGRDCDVFPAAVREGGGDAFGSAGGHAGLDNGGLFDMDTEPRSLTKQGDSAVEVWNVLG
jgi:hypothetical protein